MKVDFNNLRRQIYTQFDELTQKLNTAIKEEEIQESTAEDLRKNMESLQTRIVSLCCCYDPDNEEEFSDLSEEVNIREYYPPKRVLTIISHE